MSIYLCCQVYYVIGYCVHYICHTIARDEIQLVIIGTRHDYYLLLVEGEVRANMVAYERQVPKDLWN